MSTVINRIVLTSRVHFGRSLPPRPIGLLLAELPGVVRATVSMALRNRSSLRGKSPVWLDRAADIRFVEHQGNDESVLLFEAPPLGEAARELYQQGELWPTRPDPSDTGFDLLGDVLTAVEAADSDSDRFDVALLKRLLYFRRVFEGPFCEAGIESRRYAPTNRARLSSPLLCTAQQLLSETPPSRRIRLVGTLDVVRASTQTFGLRIETGDDVRGVLVDGSIEELAGLLNRRVLVLGKAIYRASGRVLRIDTGTVRTANEQDEFFCQLPAAPKARFDIRTAFRAQASTKGIRAIFGKWPGNETDEQIDEAIEALS